MRNTVSGEAATILQAGQIKGDVHLHAPVAGLTRPRPVPRPIVEWNPFDLGVHKAITVPDSADADPLPDLPGYLRRAHDNHLDELLGDLSQNVMVVVTGESSTGKTRALHEAISAHELLRSWPLWYPRTADELLVLAESDEIGEETVLWLNETHNHLSGPTGDLAAANLRGLLDGSHGGPLVVVGTLWPQFWAEFVAQPRSGQRDESANARSLLQQRARRIRVAERFSKQEVSALRATSAVDPRLTAAVAASGDDLQVIQTMAGGPALVERYEYPDDSDGRYATAILSAAIDARRLGHLQPIPQALLADAAPGYLTNQDRVDPPSDWFTRGMARTAGEAVLGVTALAARRVRPGAGPADGYELHDYLDQHGRGSRGLLPVPPVLWESCVAHTAHAEDLVRLTKSAYHRLLYRYADPLLDKAIEAADGDSLHNLVDLLPEYGRTGRAVALLRSLDQAREIPRRFWLSATNTHETIVLILIRQERVTEAEELLEASLSHGFGVSRAWDNLVDLLVKLDRTEDAVSLLRRLNAQSSAEEPQSAHDDTLSAGTIMPWDRDDLTQRLASFLVDQGDPDQALELVRTANATTARAWLAKQFHKAGRIDRLRALAEVGDTTVSVTLVEALLERGEVDEALELYRKVSPTRCPSPRLLDLLVYHGEPGLAVEATREYTLHLRNSPLPALAKALVSHGHKDRLIALLRELAAGTPSENAVNARDHSTEALADLLVSQGCWEDALQLARRSPSTAQRWMPRQLAAAGNIDMLRRLTEMGNEYAGREWTRLLVQRHRTFEAVEILREFAASGVDWAQGELAAVLGKTHQLDELAARAAGGDHHASAVLVRLAVKNEIPGAQALLQSGLSHDGEFPTS